MKKGILSIVWVLFLMNVINFGQETETKFSIKEVLEKFSHRIRIDKSSSGISKAEIISSVYYEESYFQLWTNNAWSEYSKTIEIFDTTAKMLQMETAEMVNGNWVPQMRYIINFDIISSTVLKFTNTEIFQYTDTIWTLAARNVYDYDSNNHLIAIIGYLAMGGNMIEYSKTLYTNNSVGEPLVEIQQKLNLSTFQFENERKITDEYNSSNGLELLSETESYWVENAWKDTSRTLYTRNNKLNPLTEKTQLIYGNGSIVDNWLREYTYDASGEYEMTLLNRYWDTNSNSWLNNSRFTFTYTNSNELFTTLYESFQGGMFVNTSRETYSYDELDRRTQELSESYIGDTWTNSYRLIYFYTPTSVKEDNLVSSFILNQNYPNPFNPITTISFNLSVGSKVTLAVFTLLGEHVLTLLDENISAGNHRITFNGGNLSSGIYLYRLTTNNFSAMKKFILMK
jgi:hypothetical protein